MMGAPLPLKTLRWCCVCTVLLANYVLVDAVKSSLCIELRLGEGRRVRDGTVQILTRASVQLRQVFPRILCIPLLLKRDVQKVRRLFWLERFPT